MTCVRRLHRAPGWSRGTGPRRSRRPATRTVSTSPLARAAGEGGRGGEDLRRSTLSALAVAALLLASAAATLHAAPRSQVACPGNLLVNPGFENGFSGRGRIAEIVGTGWTSWYEKFPGVDGINYPPDYTPRGRLLGDAGSVFDGQWSQELGTRNATHIAGLWQQVAVEPGTPVEGFVSAFAWATRGSDPGRSEPPGTYALSLGLDPSGGTDPNAASVAWSAPITLTDVWVPIQVGITATGHAVTMFTRGQPLEILPHNVSRWDNACLHEAGLTAPGPTAPPSPTVTPRPGDPTALPTLDPVPATQAALDVALGLDVVATQVARAATSAPPGAGDGPGDEAGDGASDWPVGAPGDWPGGGDAGGFEGTAGGQDASFGDSEDGDATGDGVAPEWSGLIFLVLAGLVGGVVFGLGRRGRGRGVDPADKDGGGSCASG